MKLKQNTRHVYITNSDLIKACEEGIYINIRSVDFDFIKRPKLYYSDDYEQFCFEVNWGWEQRIYPVNDYGETWLFKENAEVINEL